MSLSNVVKESFFVSLRRCGQTEVMKHHFFTTAAPAFVSTTARQARVTSEGLETVCEYVGVGVWEFGHSGVVKRTVVKNSSPCL